MTQAAIPTEEGVAAERKEPPSIESLAPHFPQLEIVEVLGRGGMGVVYKARQRSLNRWVALKLLAPERAADPEFAARFEKEALALAALNHPNIVAVYDFGESGGFFYLLMEFVDGANLRQLLSAKQFTPEEALSIVPPICEALQCAHERGIVHRDIKPENLLIDRTGVVKIADFGIAKLVGTGVSEAPGAGTGSNPQPVDSKTQWAGTPDYAAPEQRQPGASQDHRADIYSLGVVLYELLTGERPGAVSLEAPLRKIRVDFRVDEILLRALEKEPELRFPTATEFRERVLELGAAAGSRAAVAPGSPEPHPPRATLEVGQGTRGWRLPGIVAGMAALLLLGAGLLHFGKPGGSDFGKTRVEAAKGSAVFPMPEPFPVEGSLGIGSLAPLLEPEVWIQGNAVKGWEPGKVYLLLFWDTEGGVLGNVGNEKSDGTLNLFDGLAREFAPLGLVTVGHYAGPSMDKARAVLDSLGAKVSFGVSASPKDYLIDFDRWIQAAGFWDRFKGSGINHGPVAFVITAESRIAWMGGIHHLPKTLLSSVLAGAFDIGQASSQFASRQRDEKRKRELNTDFFRSLSENRWEAASLIWRDLVSGVSSEKGVPASFSLHGEFWIALAKREVDAAAGILEAVEQAEGDWTSRLDGYPMPLAIAWELVSWGALTPKAADVVQKVADAIVQKRPKDPRALQLLARVAVSRNQIAEAVAYQKAAMEQFDAKDPNRERMESDLENLSQGRAPKGDSMLRSELDKFRGNLPKGLEIGKPAPPILGGRWTRGEPVESWKRGTCYLVYFWNSLKSETVRADFRKIGDFVEELKKDGLADNFVVVAANIQETRREKAEQLVQEWASSESVRVVFDDRDLMSRLWQIEKSDQHVSQYCWIDSEGICAGFSRESEVQLLQGDTQSFVLKLVRRMLAEDAFRRATLDLNNAFESKNWAQAEQAISRIEASGMGQEIIPLASFHLAVGRGDLEKALVLAEPLRRGTSRAALLEIAVSALRSIPVPLSAALLEVAHEFASKAKNTCAHAECRPVHLSSLAWTTFQRGQRKEAIQWAERALAESPDEPESRQLLREELEAYRQGKMPAPRPYVGFRTILEVERVK